MEKKEAAECAKRIKSLRMETLKMKQVPFAEALRIDQTTVSKWERALLRPSPDMLIRLAKLANGVDKFYFLERAGLPSSFLDGRAMSADLYKASTEMVAKSLSPSNETSGSFPIGTGLRTIPLIKHLYQLGDRNATVDYTISLPNSWLPEDADVQAARVTHNISEFMTGDLIALVDISRRDPDRLQGSIVIAKTPDGNTPMKLRKEGRVYLLIPSHECAATPVKLLQPSGDWSIIGKVVKWIGDAPSPELSPRQKRERTPTKAKK